MTKQPKLSKAEAIKEIEHTHYDYNACEMGYCDCPEIERQITKTEAIKEIEKQKFYFRNEDKFAITFSRSENNAETIAEGFDVETQLEVYKQSKRIGLLERVINDEGKLTFEPTNIEFEVLQELLKLIPILFNNDVDNSILTKQSKTIKEGE